MVTKILHFLHKYAFFVFFGRFRSYRGQPDNHIGWATSLPFTPIYPTDPRTNPWICLRKNIKNLLSWPFCVFSHWKSAWFSYEVSFISTPSESRKWLHFNYVHDCKTQLRKVLWPIMQYGMLGWTPLHLSSLEELLKKILENSQKLHLFMALPNAKRIAARGSKHQKIWFGP